MNTSNNASTLLIRCLSAVILIVLCGILPGCQQKPSPESTPAPTAGISQSAATALMPEPTPTEEPVMKYTLSTSVSPAGGGTIAPEGTTYDAGTKLTLTATPASGYTFDHWSGDVTGTLTTTTVIINGDKTTTAHFKRQYILSTSANPVGGGTLKPSGGTYDAGSTAKLTATPASGAGSAVAAQNPGVGGAAGA